MTAELESLNLDGVEIEILERRLELAAPGDGCTADCFIHCNPNVVVCVPNCGCNDDGWG